MIACPLGNCLGKSASAARCRVVPKIVATQLMRWLVPLPLTCPLCSGTVCSTREHVECSDCEFIFRLIEYESNPLICSECGSLLDVVNGYVDPDEPDASPYIWPAPGQFLRCPKPYTISHYPDAYLRAEFAPSPPCDRCGAPLERNNGTSLCFDCAKATFTVLCPDASSDLEPHPLTEPGAERRMWAVAYEPPATMSGAPRAVEAYVIELGGFHRGELILAPHGDARSAGAPFLIRLPYSDRCVVSAASPFGASFNNGVSWREQFVIEHVFPAGTPFNQLKRQMQATNDILDLALAIVGGGRPARSQDEVVQFIGEGIAKVRADGKKPTQANVGAVLFERATDPRDSLRSMLKRYGLVWSRLTARF